MKKNKKIPKFKNEKQEADFWQENDSVDFINWLKVKSDKRLKAGQEVVNNN